MANTTCHYCGSNFNFPDERLGTTIQCPVCNQLLTAPAAQPVNPVFSPPPPQAYPGNSFHYQSPKPTMFTALTRYADFSGRASRREYWLFFIFTYLVNFVISFIGGFMTGLTGEPIFEIVTNIITSFIYLAFLIPNLAVAVRRCHDTGRSGWWILISLIPCVGPIIFLVYMCERSAGYNQWGENPLGGNEDEAWPCVVGISLIVFHIIALVGLIMLGILAAGALAGM